MPCAQNRAQEVDEVDAKTCRRRQPGDGIRKLRAAVGILMFLRMSDGKFTTQAAILWGAIPLEAQKRILKNAFCAKCNVVVEIVDYYGTVENGDLMIDGTCAFCGHAAARVVETSKIRIENN